MMYIKRFFVGLVMISGSSLTLAELPFVNLHVINQTAYPATFQSVIYYSVPHGEKWQNISLNVPAQGINDYAHDFDNPIYGGMGVTVQGKTIPCVPSNPSHTSGASAMDDIAIFKQGTFFYCVFTPNLV